MLSRCPDADKWLRPGANCGKLNESAFVDLAPAVARVSAIIVHTLFVARETGSNNEAKKRHSKSNSETPALTIVNERHSVVSMASGSGCVLSVLLGAETSTRKHHVKIGNGSVSREQHEIRCR